MAPAAFLVADAVERGEHGLAEFRRFREHGFDDVGRGLGETRKIVVAIDVEHVAQQEHHLIDGSPVDRHDVAPSRRARPAAQPAGDPPLLARRAVF